MHSVEILLGHCAMGGYVDQKGLDSRARDGFHCDRRFTEGAFFTEHRAQLGLYRLSPLETP